MTSRRDPDGQTDKFLAIWRQVAAHYANFPDTLAFELLNEPNGAATTQVMNPIYARRHRRNPADESAPDTCCSNRATGAMWTNSKIFVLPPRRQFDCRRFIVTTRFISHIRAPPGPAPDPKVTGIQFPGPPAKPLVPDPSLKLNPWVRDWIHDYNTLPAAKNPSSPMAFEDKIKLAREWSDYYGRPVHMGEFGCYIKADPASRARYMPRFATRSTGRSWAGPSGTGARISAIGTRPINCPMPGMHEALFGLKVPEIFCNSSALPACHRGNATYFRAR